MLKKLVKNRRLPQPETINLDAFSALVKFSARRKTLTIKVDAGQVVVQAPSFATRREIENFLRLKSQWIEQTVAHQQVQLQARLKSWRSGEHLPFLGDTIELRVERGSKGATEFDGITLRVKVGAGATEAQIQKLVQQWYKQQAARDLAERVVCWQEITGLTATDHCIKTYKARWGSCNHRAELSFNWKLIMAPPAVIDYVVVHELCHTVHFDHSPAYWRLVSRHQPDYQTHKNWLRNNGLTLEL